MPSRLEPHGRLLHVTSLGGQHEWDTSLASSGPQLLCAASEKIHAEDCISMMLTASYSEFLSSSQVASVAPVKPRVHLIRFLIQKVTQMALSVFAFL